MRQSRFTAEQIIAILAEQERGMRTAENGGDKLVHGSGGISQPRAE